MAKTYYVSTEGSEVDVDADSSLYDGEYHTLTLTQNGTVVAQFYNPTYWYTIDDEE